MSPRKLLIRVFQAALLLSVVSASSSQPRHAGPYQESFFLTAAGAHRREMKRQAHNFKIEAAPLTQLEQKHVQDTEQVASGILMTYMDKEHEQLSADITAAMVQEANTVMARKEDSTPEEAFDGNPPGPCVWFVQIGRSQKDGVPHIWKTVMVNGTRDDNFYFKGCTSKGEEGNYCKSNSGQVAGVRVLRNRNGQVVEFGSCCDPNVLDTVVDTRMQQCEPVLDLVGEAESSWMRLTHGAAWLQESAILIRLWLSFACIFIMLLMFFVHGHYKK